MEDEDLPGGRVARDLGEVQELAGPEEGGESWECSGRK